MNTAKAVGKEAYVLSEIRAKAGEQAKEKEKVREKEKAKALQEKKETAINGQKKGSCSRGESCPYIHDPNKRSSSPEGKGKGKRNRNTTRSNSPPPGRRRSTSQAKKTFSISKKVTSHGERLAITRIPLRANSFPEVNANKAKIAILHTKSLTTLTQEETYPIVPAGLLAGNLLQKTKSRANSKTKGKTHSLQKLYLA